MLFGIGHTSARTKDRMYVYMYSVAYCSKDAKCTSSNVVSLASASSAVTCVVRLLSLIEDWPMTLMEWSFIFLVTPIVRRPTPNNSQRET